MDKAEDNKELCRKINVDGTRYLAEAANKLNSKFMYISTDYVFNGEGEKQFTEYDRPEPINFYGQTKLEGEKIVQSKLEKWFIVRISWVFGINGNNFIKAMLKLANYQKEINVVSDQFGSPTYTYDLARLLIDMIHSEKYGIYHATNEGVCSWAEFAEEVFKVANKNVKVNFITTEEFPTRAKRPKNSRLSKDKLGKEGFDLLPEWENAVTRYLNELDLEVK